MSFATSGEKTVAAVLTCRSELVSAVGLCDGTGTALLGICAGGGFLTCGPSAGPGRGRNSRKIELAPQTYEGNSNARCSDP